MLVKELLPIGTLVYLNKDSIYYRQGLDAQKKPMIGKIEEYSEIYIEDYEREGSVDDDCYIYLVRFPNGVEYDYSLLHFTVLSSHLKNEDYLFVLREA